MRKSIIYPRIRSFAISSLALCSLMLFNSTANSEEFIIYRAYFNIGLAHIFPAEARFIDAKKAGSGLPALYGNDEFTDGEFTGAQLRVGVGYRFSESLRAQLEFATAGNLDFKGNTNYARAGDRQPSIAKLETRQLLLSGFYDFPPWKVISDLRIRSLSWSGDGLQQLQTERLRSILPRTRKPEWLSTPGCQWRNPVYPSPRRKRTGIYIYVDHRRGHTSHETHETRLELSLYGCG